MACQNQSSVQPRSSPRKRGPSVVQRTEFPLSAFALRASSDSNPPELAKRAKAGSRERTEYVSAIRDHAYTITAKVVVESMAKKHRHCPVSEVHDTSQHPMTRTSETKGHH